MNKNENIGEIIKVYRQNHKLTQEQLAEFMGVNPNGPTILIMDFESGSNRVGHLPL